MAADLIGIDASCGDDGTTAEFETRELDKLRQFSNETPSEGSLDSGSARRCVLGRVAPCLTKMDTTVVPDS